MAFVLLPRLGLPLRPLHDMHHTQQVPGGLASGRLLPAALESQRPRPETSVEGTGSCSSPRGEHMTQEDGGRRSSRGGAGRREAPRRSRTNLPGPRADQAWHLRPSPGDNSVLCARVWARRGHRVPRSRMSGLPAGAPRGDVPGGPWRCRRSTKFPLPP